MEVISSKRILQKHARDTAGERYASDEQKGPTFQANTAAESRAMAAAAWSCVEKMLQEHQRTSAPRAVSVSISTAVCTVMCREPAILAPLSGWVGPNSSRR